MMDGRTSSSASGALWTFFEAISQFAVTRIGVKYVNRIIVPIASANPTGLPAEDKISDMRLANFTQSSEFIRTDEIKVLVTQATLQPTAPNTWFPFWRGNTFERWARA
jgi:hypothetical protein